MPCKHYINHLAGLCDLDRLDVCIESMVADYECPDYEEGAHEV